MPRLSHARCQEGERAAVAFWLFLLRGVLFVGALSYEPYIGGSMFGPQIFRDSHMKINMTGKTSLDSQYLHTRMDSSRALSSREPSRLATPSCKCLMTLWDWHLHKTISRMILPGHEVAHGSILIVTYPSIYLCLSVAAYHQKRGLPFSSARSMQL